MFTGRPLLSEYALKLDKINKHIGNPHKDGYLFLALSTKNVSADANGKGFLDNYFDAYNLVEHKFSNPDEY